MNYRTEQKIKTREKINHLLESMPPYCKDYVVYCQGTLNRSELTIYNYVLDVQTFFFFMVTNNPTLKDLKDITLNTLEQLTPQDIYEYMAWLEGYQKEGNIVSNEAPSRARKLSALRSFLRYFYSVGSIKNNAAALAEIPTVHRKKLAKLDLEEAHEVINNAAYSSSEALTKREIKFAKYSKFRDYAILSVLLGTGIRVSELVGLNLEDLDFKHAQMKVTRKGGNEDIITLTEQLIYSINDYICQERDNSNKEEHALFLSSQEPHTRLTVRSVERLVKKYSSTIATKKVTPHALRRTYGTTLYNHTQDIYLTAEALGDSSIDVVRHHYVEASPNTKKQITEVSQILTDTDADTK